MYNKFRPPRPLNLCLLRLLTSVEDISIYASILHLFEFRMNSNQTIFTKKVFGTHVTDV